MNALTQDSVTLRVSKRAAVDSDRIGRRRLRRAREHVLM